MTDDVLLQYIREAKKYPLLTAEEEISLADAVKDGNKNAEEKLITSNLRLVIRLAKRYSNNNSQILELIQEGNIGLMKAARHFSKKFNVRFSSYAVFWIKQAFMRYLNTSLRMVKLPIRKELLIRQLQHEEENYTILHGTKPSYDELSKVLNIPIESIKKVKTYTENDTCSLDAPITESITSCLYDIIPCNTYNPENQTLDKEVKTELDKCFEMLSEREKDVVKNRYGLNGMKKAMPFAVLGKKYSISAESIRQTQLRALKKLQSKKVEIRALIAS